MAVPGQGQLCWAIAPLRGVRRFESGTFVFFPPHRSPCSCLPPNVLKMDLATQHAVSEFAERMPACPTRGDLDNDIEGAARATALVKFLDQVVLRLLECRDLNAQDRAALRAILKENCLALLALKAFKEREIISDYLPFVARTAGFVFWRD